MATTTNQVAQTTPTQGQPQTSSSQSLPQTTPTQGQPQTTSSQSPPQTTPTQGQTTPTLGTTTTTSKFFTLSVDIALLLDVSTDVTLQQYTDIVRNLAITDELFSGRIVKV